jgi:hypothetical protein
MVSKVLVERYGVSKPFGTSPQNGNLSFLDWKWKDGRRDLKCLKNFYPSNGWSFREK